MPSKLAAKQLLDKKILCFLDEPMSQHTSIKIGGKADIFCAPKTTKEIKSAIDIAKAFGLNIFYLGCGSNVIFCDEGFRGMVISLKEGLTDITVKDDSLFAGAGAQLGTVCKAAKEAELTGMEFAFGIPGSVGGAIYMDAGAFNGEIRQVLQNVTYLDEDENIVTAPVASLKMGYRTSIFQTKPWCILAGEFKLKKGKKVEIESAMQNYFNHRSLKQPLELPSAGSAFKRPQGAFAGALIDQCGLRGYRMGDAAISEKHCGFIVNLGKATCQDVIALADYVASEVEKKTGFLLEKEIQVII